MALNQITRGQVNQPTSSNPFSARGGQLGDTIVSELHGRYFEQTYNQNMFGIQGTAVTTTAGGNATFTGLAVGNPSTSGYYLVLNKVKVNQVAALTAATTIGVMYGPGSITASLTTIANRYGGGRASVMTATAGQTITAPTLWTLIGSSGSGAMTTPLLIPALSIDFEGSIVIPPGYFIASYTSAVSTTALLFDFQWEEVPILA